MKAYYNRMALAMAIVATMIFDTSATKWYGLRGLTSQIASPTTDSGEEPSVSPSTVPSQEPSHIPTFVPTFFPTESTGPSVSPTFEPTLFPTETRDPGPDGTERPSVRIPDMVEFPNFIAPTKDPTTSPSSMPTVAPSTEPTFLPTFFPTFSPTQVEDELLMFTGKSERMTTE